MMETWWAICAWCKKKARRLDESSWRDIHTIASEQIDAEYLSHGICPACEAELRSSFRKTRKPKSKNGHDE